MVEKRSPGKDVGEADVESPDRQIKHQMIAFINKDFVPACRYGLRGLHDGEHVQLPSCTNSGVVHRVHSIWANGVYCIQEISIN